VGLRHLSDDRPLSEPGEPVRVSPSTVESVLRCGLRWLLERPRRQRAAPAEQGIGNLVHSGGHAAEEPRATRTSCIEYVAERFDAIELAAVWLGGRERAAPRTWWTS
jgi:hypothetical protein